jgi:hypothetical protein
MYSIVRGSKPGRGLVFPDSFTPDLGPTLSPVQWVPGLFPGGKAAGAWRWPLPRPASRLNKDLLNGLLTYVIVYQYSETNVVHFLFSLLRIKGLYMFRALLAHHQEALHKRHLVYYVCVMSVGSTTSILLQPTDITRTQDTKCRLLSASWGWASNARSM